MFEGCFLQTRFLKIFNVSVDQKTRPTTCFKTRGRAGEGLTENQKLGQKVEKIDRVSGMLGV